MKRILALTLALLLAFSASALAESAVTYEFSVSVDEAAAQTTLTPVLEQLLQGEENINVRNLISAFGRLMDGLGMRLTVDVRDTLPVRFSADIVMKNQALMDLAFEATESEVLMTSTLIPEYALLSPIDSVDKDNVQISDEALMNAASAAFNSLIQPLMVFIGGLEPVETRGAFSGDAYEGGTVCTTFELNDADVADLLDSLMTDEVRELITLFAEAADTNPDRVFNAYASLNSKVREANAYSYLIRIIQDDTSAWRGLSVTVYSGSNQAATLSLGFNDGGLKLVYGMNYSAGANYWYSADLSCSTGEDAFGIVYASDEYLGSTSQSFAAVQASPLAELIATQLTAAVSRMDNGFAWQADCTWTDADMNILPFASVTLDIEGNADLTGVIPAADMTADLMLDDVRVVGMTTVLKQDDPLPAMQEGLIVCDVTSRSNDQLELQDEILTKLGNKLTVRMIKLLPLDVLMSVPNLLNVQ